jgi:hypothetical protein
LEGVLQQIAEGVAEGGLKAVVQGLRRYLDAELGRRVAEVLEAGERVMPVSENEGGEE